MARSYEACEGLFIQVKNGFPFPGNAIKDVPISKTCELVYLQQKTRRCDWKLWTQVSSIGVVLRRGGEL